jgi:hypothetical protein
MLTVMGDEKTPEEKTNMRWGIALCRLFFSPHSTYEWCVRHFGEARLGSIAARLHLLGGLRSCGGYLTSEDTGRLCQRATRVA